MFNNYNIQSTDFSERIDWFLGASQVVIFSPKLGAISVFVSHPSYITLFYFFIFFSKFECRGLIKMPHGLNVKNTLKK